MFRLKIFKYGFIDKRPIVYIDESGFAVDAPRNGGYTQRGNGTMPVKIGMQEAG